MAMNKKKASILVVDDAPDTLEILHRNLTSQGYRVYTAGSVPEAIQFLENTSVDLVITDLKMPKVSGLDLVRHVRANMKDTEIMMITGYATVESAVKAIKNGAEEYLPKPFTDDELFVAVEQVLDKLRARRAARPDVNGISPPPQGMMGESPGMQNVYKMISKAATTSATVLITGESGTGKELVARAIHYNSKRAAAPFVPINCGGIPESLLESELFGHVKGAFTGAGETRAGFFQTAEGGTIFLDEIGETSLSMQVKLLRVLQDKEISMVGSSRARKVDVRIVAATNKDLTNLLKKGIIREDLFFRLSVLTISIPPLRDRGDDILLLSRYFADKFSKEFGRAPLKFTDNALDVLRTYNWPGNVRELENLIQSLVVMAEREVVDVTDLPSLMRYTAPRHKGLMRTLAEVERDHIENVLANVSGNKTRAAEILGIDRKTLREKLKDSSGKKRK
jgi:DNA-binding NtrC family response regulator